MEMDRHGWGRVVCPFRGTRVKRERRELFRIYSCVVNGTYATEPAKDRRVLFTGPWTRREIMCGFPTTILDVHANPGGPLNSVFFEIVHAGSGVILMRRSDREP